MFKIFKKKESGSQIRDHKIKCPFGACASNYEGYCNSIDKEIKLKLKTANVDGKLEGLLDCRNFDWE